MHDSTQLWFVRLPFSFSERGPGGEAPRLRYFTSS